MIIKSLRIKNHQSYGNVVTELKFNQDKGDLILLQGKNGSGKSGLLSALEFTLYGVVRGKNGKRRVLSSIPNRLNGHLLDEVDFSTPSCDVTVSRSLNPNKVKLYENGVEYPKANKIQDKIEEHVGLDMEMFKSFVSMSVNDFKNFISLPAEDKRKLFDNFFNMDAINAMAKILRQLKTENEMHIAEHKRAMLAADSTIASFKESIRNLSIRIEEGNMEEVNGLKEDIKSFRPKFEELTSAIEAHSASNEDLRRQVEAIRNSMTSTKTRRAIIQEQVSLLEKGECPTCGTVFCGDEHVEKTSSLRSSLAAIDELVKEESASYNTLNASYLESGNQLNKYNREINDIKSRITSLKARIETLNSKDNKALQSSIEEFQRKIAEMNSKKDASSAIVGDRTTQSVYYDKALDVFSDLGIKQWMIEKIVEPINHFIVENIRDLNLPFTIELDKEFDAKVFDGGEEVDPDTLSTGEARKVNICIMLAYLKLIRMRRHVNVLFLDEVFSSIDMESIKDILAMFRRFASDYNVNVLLVHHSELDYSLFDRTIKVHKTIFTSLEDSGPSKSM